MKVGENAICSIHLQTIKPLDYEHTTQASSATASTAKKTSKLTPLSDHSGLKHHDSDDDDDDDNLYGSQQNG